MRFEQVGKKKLIVAFYFLVADRQSANRTGWDCENCRRYGLEIKRRCGFIPPEQRGAKAIVWGRHGVQIDQCPKSLITGESIGLLEEFFAWRQFGFPEAGEMEARKMDAFLILREQIELEERHGKTQH